MIKSITRVTGGMLLRKLPIIVRVNSGRIWWFGVRELLEFMSDVFKFASSFYYIDVL